MSFERRLEQQRSVIEEREKEQRLKKEAAEKEIQQNTAEYVASQQWLKLKSMVTNPDFLEALRAYLETFKLRELTKTVEQTRKSGIFGLKEKKEIVKVPMTFEECLIIVEDPLNREIRVSLFLGDEHKGGDDFGPKLFEVQIRFYDEEKLIQERASGSDYSLGKAGATFWSQPEVIAKPGFNFILNRYKGSIYYGLDSFLDFMAKTIAKKQLK